MAARTPLIGQTPDSPLDTNTWASTVTGTGSLTSAGIFVLHTGSTANSTSILRSNNRAFMTAGQIHTFDAGVIFADTGAVNNIRRWGPLDANCGFFWCLNGTALQVGWRINGVDTIVTPTAGSPIKDAALRLYQIDYAQGGAQFYQDGVLMHVAFNVVIQPTIHLPIGFENVNSGGGTANTALTVTGVAIDRIGVEGQPGYIHVNTATAALTVKQSPGKLHRVTINTRGSGSTAALTLYDNDSGASGPIIAVLDVTQNISGQFDYNLTFNVGLTIALTSGATAADLTIIYA